VGEEMGLEHWDWWLGVYGAIMNKMCHKLCPSMVVVSSGCRYRCASAIANFNTTKRYAYQYNQSFRKNVPNASPGISQEPTGCLSSILLLQHLRPNTSSFNRVRRMAASRHGGARSEDVVVRGT
jgi:hypothetical protein